MSARSRAQIKAMLAGFVRKSSAPRSSRSIWSYSPDLALSTRIGAVTPSDRRFSHTLYPERRGSRRSSTIAAWPPSSAFHRPDGPSGQASTSKPSACKPRSTTLRISSSPSINSTRTSDTVSIRALGCSCPMLQRSVGFQCHSCFCSAGRGPRCVRAAHPLRHDRRTLLHMRTRQKLTAVGAIALATTAVVGGAVVTSHAMADSAIPEKATLTVVSMTDGSDPIKCVYDDVDLPTAPTGAGQPGFTTGSAKQSGAMLNIITGSGPAPDGAPTLISGSAQAEGPIHTGPGVAGGGAGAVSVSADRTPEGVPHLVVSHDGDGLPPLPPPAGAKVIDLS